MKKWFPIFFLIIFSFLLYLNTLNNDFVRAEAWRAREDETIRSLKNIPLFFTPNYWLHEPIGFAGVEYRPLRQVFYAVDYFLYKDNPRGWKLTNALLHVINVVLVYFFALHLFNRSPITDYRLPVITALLFAAHPVHTESINWLKNRTDLICSIFFLSSLIMFLKAITHKSTRASEHQNTRVPEHQNIRAPAHRVTMSPCHRVTPSPSSRFSLLTPHALRLTPYTLSLLCFLLALFGKIMAVSLLLILCLYIFFFSSADKLDTTGEQSKFYGFMKLHKVIIPFWVILFVWLFSIWIPASRPAIGLAYRPELYRHLLVVFKTVAFYIKVLFFPLSLCTDPPCPIPQSIFQKDILVSIGVVVLFIPLLIKLYKSYKLWAFSLLFFFITLIPVSGIIFINVRPLGENRLYIPSLGVCLFLAIIVKKIIEKNKALGMVLFLTLLGFYSTRTVIRNLDWKNDFTLWSKTVKTNPDSAIAHGNLGYIYSQRGLSEQAIREYKKVVEIDGENSRAAHESISMYKEKGEDKQAKEESKRLKQFDDSLARAYCNLGIVYTNLGELEKAINNYRLFLKINPHSLSTRSTLGVLYIRVELYEEAIQEYKKILEIEPNSTKALGNLGVVYYKKGAYEKAIQCYQKAIGINPADVESHNNLGTLYHKIGMNDEAIQEYKMALKVNPNIPALHFNLAVVYFDKKLYPEAKEEFEKVLALDPGNPGAKRYLKRLRTGDTVTR